MNMKRKENSQMLPKGLQQLKYQIIRIPQGSVRLVKKTQEGKISTYYLLITKGVTSSSPIPLKTRHFIFDNGENASQAAEIVNGVYGANTVTANCVQFWFRRFRSGIFHVKDSSSTGRPVVENVDKITEIIEVDRHRGEAAQTVAKTGLTARKVLLRIWSNWKGIIYYKLLPYGQILNSDLYCQQLDCLKLAIDLKRSELSNRRGAVFHQNIARPHTSVVTRQKLWELGWEVVMHPPYSPDLAPSDYHLYPALQNLLSDKKLGSQEKIMKIDY
ncbi:histone-lysine N-methyltransferase SETMAR [Trichonephila clavipes]|nr:histone-lysine N-methyltransferase SETMAR [Trichonephila clavipes]